MAKQAQLNAVLDLDKHERQGMAEPEGEKAVPASFAAKVMGREAGGEGGSVAAYHPGRRHHPSPEISPHTPERNYKVIAL